MTLWETAPVVVGHRGGRGPGWPAENTLEAFEQARAQGAMAIELDVRLSADRRAVVFHDATLSRMTEGRDSRQVERVSVDTLRTVALHGGGRIPSLGEVLAWCEMRRVAVNVELKHDVPSRVGLVRAVGGALSGSSADVLLSSFDPALLAMMAIVAPAVPRALLTHAGQARWAEILQNVSRPPFVRAIHLESRQAVPDVVAACLRRRLRVGVWTVNDAQSAQSLVGLGVASIITDSTGDILRAIRDVRGPTPVSRG